MKIYCWRCWHAPTTGKEESVYLYARSEKEAKRILKKREIYAKIADLPSVVWDMDKEKPQIITRDYHERSH